MNAQHTFLELGRNGRSSWWRYLVGFLLILVSYGIGNVLLIGVLAVAIATNPQKVSVDKLTGAVSGIDPLVLFLAMGMVFVCMFVGVWLVIRFLHGRSLLSLITPYDRMNGRNIAFSFLVWSVLGAISTYIGSLVFPGSIHWQLEAEKFLYFLPAVLIIIPIQTLVEELIFRGYLLQGMSSLIRNPWLLAGANGVIFMLPHLWTPGLTQIHIMVLIYFTTGFILAVLTIRTNTLEVAYGMHLANNLLAALFVTYKTSPIKTPAMFMANELNPPYELANLIVAGVILYLLASKYAARGQIPEA